MRKGRLVQLAMFIVLLSASGSVAVALPSSAPVSKRAEKAVRVLIQHGLVRAEIVSSSGSRIRDYRVDRGIVRKIRKRRLKLREADGTMVSIRLSKKTRIKFKGHKAGRWRIRVGMHATAIRKGNSAASKLFVSKKSNDKSQPTIKALLRWWVRVEVVSDIAGQINDSRADTGVIESVEAETLTLDESDGTVADIPIDSTAEVQIKNKTADITDLAAGMQATTIQHSDGSPTQIWAVGKTTGEKGRGGGGG
jgi:hypothetical protein